MTVFIEQFTLASATLGNGAVFLNSNFTHRDRISLEEVNFNYPTIVLADNPGGYWQLNEGEGTTYANTVAGNAGSSVQAAWIEADSQSTYRPKHGSPSSGDSNTDDYEIDVAHYANINLDWDNDFTVEFWFRFTDAQKSMQYCWEKNDGTSGLYLAIDKATGDVIVEYFTASGNRTQTWAAAFDVEEDNGGWHHCVFAFMTEVSRTLSNNWLYIDGVLKGGESNTGSLPANFANTDKFTMGGRSQSVAATDILRGAWSDFAIYPTTALGLVRVQGRYNSVQGLFGGDSVGNATWSFTPSGVNYPFGAQVRRIMLPGFLGRFQSNADFQFHTTVQLQIGSGPFETVRPNEQLLGKAADAGETITIRVNFSARTLTHDTKIFSQIEEQLDGFGPSLVLDSQRDPLPPIDAVQFVVEI